MKILLVSTNISSEFHSIFSNGAAALSAWFKQHGYNVKYVHLENRSDVRQYKEILKSFKPDVVGISINSTEQEHLGHLSKSVKNILPGAQVVVGGHFPSLDPEFCLAHDDVDAVCVGEGESAFLEYIRRLEKGGDIFTTPNFWFKQNGKIVGNSPCQFVENLDDLPYVDREDVDFQKVLDLNRGTLVLVIGRGFCPYNCSFCVNDVFRRRGKGRYVRTRSVENVLDEIEWLSKRYSFNNINFRDENIGANREWLLEFCESYSSRFNWSFDCFSRCDSLDREVMDALKKAGCRHIFIGLESGSFRVRKEILNKDIPNSKFIEVIDYLNELGIKVVVSNIVGLPYETEDDFRETIELNKRLHRRQVVFSSSYGAAPKIFIFAPFPNTRLYGVCKEEGWLRPTPKKYRIYRETFVDMPQFTPKQILRMHSRFRYEVYKDSYPFFALLFLIYDRPEIRFITENMPGSIFSNIHYFFAKISARFKPRES